MTHVFERVIRDLSALVAAGGKTLMHLEALVVVAFATIAGVYFWTNPGHTQIVGSDSVVIGQVPPNAKVGDRSVVIGSTDSRGNTILNQPMAIGNGACAGPGSIAIGAGAGAGACSPTATQTK